MTRALGVVLALSVLSSGCGGPSVLGPCCRTTGGKVGVGLAVAGASIAVIGGGVCAGEPGCNSSDKDIIALSALGALIVGVLTARIAEASYTPQMPALSEPIAARDPRAHTLTVEAHRAAWQGQCAGVPALAQQVNALDAEYYTRVFAADPAIQHCIDAR